ncbi:MAG: cobyric acid synthase [Treponema sp.]|nr:cobyric acid synthase [Treponema sp.]
MVQGTMSNAGKSFIVAGLCRIFKQDGFSVAPFKSQNMALNSFVTNEGLEMGRAQVMQAEAAGVEPSVLMNPILLKPTSDVGSQVIVNGEVLGNMGAKEYFAFKKSLVPQIKYAYETLAASHDIIVIEGAGSPAEINLKENDIVNMGMAQIADSPVLLVADIDRGGVFAQLVGTVDLLEPNERSRVKGLIINKFRGDKSILDSGIKMLEEKTGIPVVGTVPYMKVQLDDEDSLSENLHTLAKYRDKKDEIQLAIVRLPHISNFTDFIPLQNHPAINAYYAEKPEDLGNPDCIILPGTKNTLEDLKWLKNSGFAALIQKEAEKGTLTVGICGGFQMLGKNLRGSEDSAEKTENLETGLSLLPVETEFSSQKALTRVSGSTLKNSCLANIPVSGYEIHMGRTSFINDEKESASSFSEITDSVTGESKLDGAVKGNVLGTYIHGLFDGAEFTKGFVRLLAERKGITPKEWSQTFNAGPVSDFKDSQYNLLADTLREHLDMKKIYEIMGLPKESF